MLIVGFILVFISGAILGWQVRQYIAIRNIQMMIDRLEQQEAEEDKPDYIRIKIEQHGDSYYAYSLDDDTFMAQGKFREELEDNLREKFPGKRFAAPGKNLEEMFNDSI